MSGFFGFEFSEEQNLLRESLRRFLADACPSSLVRETLEGRQAFGATLWSGLAKMGCIGAAIPEQYGGSGLGPVEICVIAEELGRVLAPIPSLSTIYLFAEIVKAAGNDEQKALLLPDIARGQAIGTLAAIEMDPKGRKVPTASEVRAGKLYGRKHLVPDGMIADHAIVVAREGERDESLFLVDLHQDGVVRRPLSTIDPTRGHARIEFDGAAALPIGAVGNGSTIISEAMARAAVFVSFEQIGGAEQALVSACDYARQRFAFGRPIGSFQAVKILLADMHVSLVIARANALRAIWALADVAGEAEWAAARAHLSASAAFGHVAADTIQVHGGTGFMWDSDPHLFYRRAEALGQSLGGARHWERILIEGRRSGAGGSEAVSVNEENAAESEFRASARAWVAANAPWHLREAIERSPVGALDLGPDALAAQKAWQQRKHDAGWACLGWPTAYGGRDATPMERIIWHQEEGCFARLSNLFHNGQGMCAPTLMDFASDEQKAELLPRISSGQDVWCQLFSEPAAGSDLAGLRTRADRDGDGWVINGQKIWTSGGQYADWGLLIARSDFDVAKHKGLTAFFIDMRAPGVEVRPIRQMNDHSGFAEVFFHDLRIPDTQRLGGIGDGWRVALTTLSHERLAIGLEMPTGFDDLFDYCAALELENGPALVDRHVISRLARFECQAAGLENFMLGSLSRFAKGELPGPENSIIKLVAGKMMQDIAGFAIELQGEAGILTGTDECAFGGRFQGMLLRAPATRIEGGSDQILRNILAERVLGMPPDMRADKNLPFSAIPAQSPSR